MSILTAGQPSLTKRQPSLAIAAREAAAERQRSARQASPIKRWMHRIFAILAIVFASLTVFGSSAQAAWPWELVENGMKWAVTACGPNDVPTPHNRSGNYTQTVVPQFGGNAGNGGNGLDRITAAARQAQVGNPGHNQDATSLIAGVQNHGYERYGYSTLGWDAYGSSCFVGPGQLFTAPVNALFNIFVTLPAMVLTSIMNFALSNVFYDMFWGWVSPFMALFANIFAPWVLAIVLVGGAVVILIRSKGSLTRILQLTAWMLAMLGLFFGIQNQGLGEKVRSLSNNFVTQAVNLIACQVTTANIGGTNVATSTTSACGLQPTSRGVGVDGIDLTNPTASSPGASFRISGGIDQAIWYSIPYQVWSQGTVGTAQSFADRNLTEQGKISWSAAILNAKHVDRNDALGRQVDLYSGLWNQAGYNATGDDGGQKMRIWTDPDDKGWRDEADQPDLKAWDTVPYLGVVKAMCNDVATGEGKSEDLGQNRWGYMGNCDAAGAGVGFLPTFKGDAFWERGSAVMSGSVALTVTMIPLLFVAFYLMVQRMLGYFILMFAPLFIGIGAFPDEKRMGFVKRYGELFLGNLIKQILAMCLVLFVLTGVSGVLNASVAVAWYLKPVAVIMFALGLLMFAIPLSRILKAAAKGDTSVVDKTLNAPQRAAKTTAKVVGVAAIAGATLGAGAIASGAVGLGSAAAGGGAAGAATGAGMAGLKAGIGGVAKAGLGGAARSAAAGLKGGLSQKGLQGAAAGLTRMVKNGDALKMLRYSGMGDSALGQTLRKGLAFGQVGLNVVGKNASNPAVDKGLLRARSEGIELLDANDRMSDSPAYARDERGELTPEGRRQAEEDYDAIYKGDPEGEAADKAASDAQRTLYANYRKMNPGQYLPGDPSNPAGVGRPRTPQETAEGVAATMSTSSWGTQVLRTKVKTGEEILQAAGGTEALLSGDQTGPALDKLFAGYGNMANIDPAHPAAGSFVNLAFASRSDDAEYKEAAFADFIAQVNEHGVPDRIGGFHATAEFAAGHNPATVLSAMPSLSPESTMAERAQAAGNFTVAAMTVPQDAPFREALDSYRSALLDPDMSVGVVNELKSALARDISAADNAAMAQASSAFVGTTDGTTGFRINGESTLDWKEAPTAPTGAAAVALVGAGATTATAPAAPAPSSAQQAAAPAPAPAAPAAPAAQAPAAPAPAPAPAPAAAAPAPAAPASEAPASAAPAPASAPPAPAAPAPAPENATSAASAPSEAPQAAVPAVAAPQTVRVVNQPAPAVRGHVGASASSRGPEAGISEEVLNERLTEQREAIVEEVQGAIHEAVMEANAETQAANGRLAETAKKPRSSGLFKKDRER